MTQRKMIKNDEIEALERPLKKQCKSLYTRTIRARAAVKIATEDELAGFGEANGFVEVPAAPGLGIEADESIFK